MIGCCPSTMFCLIFGYKIECHFVNYMTQTRITHRHDHDTISSRIHSIDCIINALVEFGKKSCIQFGVVIFLLSILGCDSFHDPEPTLLQFYAKMHLSKMSIYRKRKQNTVLSKLHNQSTKNYFTEQRYSKFPFFKPINI